MSTTPPPAARPHRAFEHLDEFLARGLPGLLRRMRDWKGLHPTRHGDVVEDLRQDLWLDCLENADIIESLSDQQRRARWYRLLEHRHYQLRVRGRDQIHAGVLPEHVACSDNRVDPAGTATNIVPDPGVGSLLGGAAHMKNGRINVNATSRLLGIPSREIRGGWSQLADALGYGGEFLGFWRQRLVEALVGLAADMLRDQGLLRVHDEVGRRRPDPRARLRRIRGIKRQLSVRPVPRDLRRALARWNTTTATTIDPDQALQAAELLAPDDPAVLLWRFEHAIATGDLSTATRALWRSRQAGADPVRVVLARARLLEAAGRVHQATLLLIRASTRHRGDPRLRAALDSVRSS